MKIFKPKYLILISSLLLIAFLLSVSIVNFEQLNRVVTDFLKYLNLLVTPLGIILGIILGYPLLKKKLIENYVTKQYDIIYEANRKLRKECLLLLDKYPDDYISTPLQEADLQQAIANIKHLANEAFDANPDAHKYSLLLLNSLLRLQQASWDRSYFYRETLTSFINIHIEQIYDYAKSLGKTIGAEIKEHRHLVKKLDSLVTGNKFIELQNFDFSLSYAESSSLLVIFFSHSFARTPSDFPFLFLSAYRSAPSPCPIARLMFNRGIYLPPVMTAPSPFFEDKELCLIGFKRIGHKGFGNTPVTHSYICYYANLTDCGFVEGTIRNEQSLKEFRDVYIKSVPIDINAIKDFKKFNHEIISFKIDEVELKKAFQKNKKRLLRQIKKEL